MRLARLLPPVLASSVLLLAGCHILAVPVASRAFRPAVGEATPAAWGLAYQELELRGAGAVRMPAWRVAAAGDGRRRGLVLLLAENGGNRAGERMLWLAAEVSGMGFDALLFDLRGHGDSTGINTYGLGETLDLLEVLARLRQEDPDLPIAAVGFSLGAACILRAMSLTDAIEAAVCFAAYSGLDHDLVRHELAFQTAQGGAARLARLLSARLLVASLRLWAGCPRLPEPADLETDRPVILYHCTGDPEIPFDEALAIRARARAPLLELRAVDRAAHLPPLEDRGVWDPFVVELRALLDRALP